MPPGAPSTLYGRACCRGQQSLGVGVAGLVGAEAVLEGGDGAVEEEGAEVHLGHRGGVGMVGPVLAQLGLEGDGGLVAVVAVVGTEGAVPVDGPAVRGVVGGGVHGVAEEGAHGGAESVPLAVGGPAGDGGEVRGGPAASHACLGEQALVEPEGRAGQRAFQGDAVEPSADAAHVAPGVGGDARQVGVVPDRRAGEIRREVLGPALYELGLARQGDVGEDVDDVGQ